MGEKSDVMICTKSRFKTGRNVEWSRDQEIGLRVEEGEKLSHTDISLWIMLWLLPVANSLVMQFQTLSNTKARDPW